MNLISMIANCGSSFYRLFFPKLCVNCRAQLSKGIEVLCLSCFVNLPYTHFKIYEPNEVAKRFYGRIELNAAAALFYFSKGSAVQAMMHELKYRSRQDVGFFLGELIGLNLKKQFKEHDFPNYIIPVPLHPKKQKARGFNQSLAIAEGIESVLEIEISNDFLVRQLNNPSQTNKSRIDRWENVKTAFLVKADNLKCSDGIHFLLVDDVITTGSTIEACASELSKNSQNKVTIISVAYANL